jgi:hypothetical protein
MKYTNSPNNLDPQPWNLENKPVGAVEILSGILTADPRPFVLFSQLQEWTATTKKNQLSNEFITVKITITIKQQTTRYLTCKCLSTSSVALESLTFKSTESSMESCSSKLISKLATKMSASL